MKQAYLRILRHSFKTNNKNKDHMQILHSIEKGAKPFIECVLKGAD